MKMIFDPTFPSALALATKMTESKSEDVNSDNVCYLSHFIIPTMVILAAIAWISTVPERGTTKNRELRVARCGHGHVQQRRGAFVSSLRSVSTFWRKETEKRLAKPSKKLAMIVGTLIEYSRLVRQYYLDITSDVKPGLWECIAFRALMRQLKATRSIARDNRYEKEQDSRNATRPSEELQGMEEALKLAQLAYLEDHDKLHDELKAKDFDLVLAKLGQGAGSASYFIAIDRQRKVLYISIKGSTKLTDFITNFSATSHPYTLKGPYTAGGRTMIWLHEGFSSVAQCIADDIEPVVEELLIPRGYKVNIVGHSLGGSLACTAGILLRSRLAVRNQEILFDEGRMISVTAFAAAPFIGGAASNECKTFIRTLVNNSDLVPRLSTVNFTMVVYFLKGLRTRLEEKNMRPANLSTLTRFVRMVASGDPIMTMEEVNASMEEAYEEALEFGIDNC